MIFVTNGLSRHGFLRTGAAAGGGLLLSLRLPLGHRDVEATRAGDFAPNAFIRVGTDGQIVLTMPSVEMGQGTCAAISMLIAEELEVEPSQIRLEHAPANDGLSLAGVPAAGGETALRASSMPIRQACAIARAMLVTAAAQRWNVDPGACQTRSGEVIHSASGRHFWYGELAAYAGRLPAPEIVALKRPTDVQPIGKPPFDIEVLKRTA